MASSLYDRGRVEHLDPMRFGLHMDLSASPQKEPAGAAGAAASAHLSNYAWLLNNPMLSDVKLLIGCGVYGKEGGSREAGRSPPGSAPSTPVSDGLPVLPPPPPEVYHAHKVVLAVQSLTYRTMFESDHWAEGDGSDSAVPMYYTHETCLCVLRHMYCCDQSFSVDNALEVLDAAVFYGLEGLREATVKFLAASVTVRTVVDYLCAAVMYSDRTLRELCVAFIRRRNAMRCIMYCDSDLFRVPQSVLAILVEETVIDSDINILKRLHDWAEDQHRRRKAAAEAVAVTLDAVSPQSMCTAATTPNRDSASASGGSINSSSAGLTSASTPSSGPVAFDACPGSPGGAVPSAGDLLAPFLKYINFTNMSHDELFYVETLGTVPVDLLYRCFRNKVLGVDDGGLIARRGGLQLRWDDSTARDLCSVENDNHLKKDTSDGWEHVCALNKFSEGCHYWVYTVHELRVKHDCFVGVTHRRGGYGEVAPEVDEQSILYEPCCNVVYAPGGEVTQSPDAALPPRGPRINIGICVDFTRNVVSFYHHDSSLLLYEVAQDPLPSPLYPCTSLQFKDNGGVSLSEATTFRADRKASPGLCDACGLASLRSPTSLRGFAKSPESSASGHTASIISPAAE